MAQTQPNLDCDAAAIRLLKEDHRKLELLFDAYDALLAPGLRRELAGKISDLMRAHLAVKERLLYPFLLIRLDDMALINRATAAHVVMQDILNEIDTAGTVDEAFDDHINALRHATLRSIRMEEHEIYPLLGDFKSGLDALGDAMTFVRERIDARIAQAALQRETALPSTVTAIPRREARTPKSLAAGRK